MAIEGTHLHGMPTEGAVTVSLGVLSVDPPGDLDRSVLYSEVAELLYQAKQQGRNRVVSGRHRT